ncbi:MAG TPA: phosphoribosylformylglycinamidine synthase [Paenibacillaceae bacterium]|nr:phosphoribosylformylglycinamidine synthase [Paenibacillaceae bacterium]
MFKAIVYVTLKESVLDPQGSAVRGTLHKLGFEDAKDIRVGKYLEVTVDAGTREKAEGRVTEMCEKLLANTVIEDYRIELMEV